MSPRGERAGRGGAGRERAGAEPRSPHRDRSSSASRSVRFRVEIGSGRRYPSAPEAGRALCDQGDLLGKRVDAAAHEGRNECGRSPEGPERSALARAGAIIAGSVIIRARRSQVVG